MKNFLTLVLVAVFVLAGSAIASAQLAIDLNGIKIDAYIGIGFVNAHKSKAKALSTDDDIFPRLLLDDSQYWAKDIDETNFIMDLTFTKTFSNEGQAIIALRGGTDDTGVSLGLFRGAVNDDQFAADFDELGNLDDILTIKRAYYTQSFFDKFLTGSIGKVDSPTSANSVAASVGSFFTDDATIPGASNANNNPYGIILDFAPTDKVTITYAYLTQGHGSSQLEVMLAPYYNEDYVYTSRRLTLAQYNTIIVNIQPLEKGNYRIGYWRSLSGREFTEIREANYTNPNGGYYRYLQKAGTGEPSGLFLSFDQEIFSILSAFARAGYRLDKTVGEGESQAGKDVQIGIKIGGSLWGRGNDHIFIAVGQAWYQEDIMAFTYYRNSRGIWSSNIGYEYYRDEAVAKEEPETHFEINYKIGVNDLVSFIVFAQYVSGIYKYPGKGSDELDGSLYPPNNNGWGYASGLKLVATF